jgi:hypothetical protein|uniref:Zinc finger domain-containing protein n=1 Tax=virus sp. ctE0n6 TaxID=2827985 RepID=A0A8S5RFW6_9VIRU|nr:MAG TPA: zinc finger domain-containing protein [virus sp. ctE0n6]
MICKDCQNEMNLHTYEELLHGEYYLYQCDCGSKVGMTLKDGKCLGIEWKIKDMNQH